MSTTSRLHHFRDEHDDRTVVETTMLPTGRYKAYVTEGLYSDIIAYGFGHTRHAAIADLYANIELEDAQ